MKFKQSRSGDHDLHLNEHSNKRFQPYGHHLAITMKHWAAALAIAVLLATPSYGDNPVLLYSTFLGGNNSDLAADLAVGDDGSFYIVGTTYSTNFPTLSALQGSFGGGPFDVFVTKIDANGASLAYSTYLGGTGRDGGSSIAVDTNGAVYITGWTDSSDFPTSNAFQNTFGGMDAWGDAFAVKIATNGATLEYATYLGGTADEFGNAIAVDASGYAHIIGEAESTNYPVTGNAYGGTLNGAVDGMLTILTPDGTGLHYSTYIGGTNWDSGRAIALDNSNAVLIAGMTSASDNFPTTNGQQTVYGGGSFDGWYAKFSPGATNVEFLSLLGGASNEHVSGIAADASGLYIVGDTDSADHPISNAYQSVLAGSKDAFITKFDPAGSNIVYSTYIGGIQDETVHGMDLHTDGSVLIVGEVASTNYPTKLAVQNALSGASDALITRLGPDGTNLLMSTYLGGTSTERGAAIVSGGNAIVHVVGRTASGDFTTQNPYDGTFNGGTNDAFLATLDCDTNSYVQFSVASSSGLESTTIVDLTVTLSPTNASTVTVQYAATGGSATGSGIDYTLAPGVLTFLPGETAMTVTVAVVDDPAVEFSETIELTLSAPTNAMLGSNTVLTYSIEAEEEDAYEANDIVRDAKPYPVSQSQIHTLHTSSDEDWISFYALTNFEYNIETTNVSPHLDLVIDVFQDQTDGSLLNVASVDSAGLGGNESTIVSNPPSGLYYVRITAWTGAPKKLSGRAKAGDEDSGSYGLNIDILDGGGLFIIIAYDEVTRRALPASSYITFNGGAAQNLDGETAIAISGVGEGIHTTALTVVEAGYLDLEDPEMPNQVQNPLNTFYGNPRHCEVTNNGSSVAGYVAFSCVPVIHATATVRDKWTHERIEQVDVVFEASSGHLRSNHVLNGHAYNTLYKSNWSTKTTGAFPTNTILPATNSHMTISRTGFESTTISNAIHNVQAGDTVDIGDVYLRPADTNFNGIADTWEVTHFGVGANIDPTGDPDVDHYSNLLEYKLGTDPMDGDDFLHISSQAQTDDGVLLTWRAIAGGRVYQPVYSDDLSSSNWMPVAVEAMEASGGQSQMQWLDTTVTGQNVRCYGINVVFPDP